MSDQPRATSPAEPDGLLAELADDLAGQISRRYRIDRADAAALIVSEFGRQPKLLAAVTTASVAADVRRLRVYQDAAAAAKRGIYRQLRRYVAGQAGFGAALGALAALPPGAPAEDLAGAALAVARAHVSTAERLPHREEFLAALSELITSAGACGTIVDVGGGVFPLLLPVGWLAERGVGQYWALDKDPGGCAAVTHYARVTSDQRLRAIEWNLASGWEPLFAAGLPRRCDLGVLFKIVPVVARQAPELTTVLAATPADRLLVSGSRIAMAKREDIERRELGAVRRFCAAHGFRQVAGFRTADEFCLLVERS